MTSDVMDQADFFQVSARGMQHTGVRQANQRAVLTLIAGDPGIPNAELSRRSGLAPQTVSAILIDLEEAALITRGEVLRGRRGQPATPFFLNPRGAFAIGCEIGWRQIEVVLRGLGSEVLGHYRRDYTYPDARTIFSELGEATRQLTQKLAAPERTTLIGMGLAAPNHIERGIERLSGSSEQSALWAQIDLKSAAEAATGLSVQVFNDGNAGCWAELIAHPSPRPGSFAYILIGTFIGAGIVAQSTLWQGPTGNSANLGAMLVTDRNGKETPVYRLASLIAFEDRLREAAITVPSTSPMVWPWGEWGGHVDAWIEDASRGLAKAIVNTQAVFEFGSVIIDGVMPKAIVERIIAATELRMADFSMLARDPPVLHMGNLGAAAPAIGAAQLPIYRRFFSRDPNDMQP